MRYFSFLRHTGKARYLCAAACVAFAAPAMAQEAGDSAAVLPAASAGATSYSPADFARFAPKTALDMLNQVPGFTIQQGEEKRGLGQASTNILINGERFSGKSNDIVTELGRISASDVVRIDIVDGATLNVPGLSGKVADIFIRKSNKISGQFQWNPKIKFRHAPMLLTNGKASVTGSTGNLEYTFSFINESFIIGARGPEIAKDGTGAIIDVRNEKLDRFDEQPKIGVGLKYKSDSGDIANLNAAYQIFRMQSDEISLRHGPNLVDRNRHFREQEREYNYELGGDYEFGLGKGRLKLIGLRYYEHSSFAQQLVTHFADNSPNTGQRYEYVMDEGESILRGEYSWKAGAADWQITAEGALNTLDYPSSFGLLDVDGTFHMGPETISSVKEKRGEASISYGRPLSPSLTLQALLAGEYSQLSQTGPNGLTRTFYRPKGLVSLAWKASPRLNISAKVERVVGQLNFFDFMASLDINNGTGNAGNPNLVPTQSWNGQIEATRNLGAYGTITARIFGRLIEDVVDVIPIGATGQSLGNLDKATLLGFYSSGTLNLDPFGVKGAKIDFNVQFQKSSVKDPLTGMFRQINETKTRNYSINYRHDIQGSNWAYGASYIKFKPTPFYRLDEWSLSSINSGDFNIFIEHKNVLGLVVKATLENIFSSMNYLSRAVYDGRRINPLLYTENRSRDNGPTLTFSISRKF